MEKKRFYLLMSPYPQAMKLYLLMSLYPDSNTTFNKSF